MSTNTIKNPTKKNLLKEISNDLREFNFSLFDPRKDKAILMKHLQVINSKLGKMIRRINDEKSEER